MHEPFISELRRVFELYLDRHVEELYGSDERLAIACRYGLSNGGKRVRPLLALLSAYACGHNPEEALPGALAVEMIHTYSLVHDDLPICDNDSLRRGKPSMHIAFDEVTALLCGDALLTDAFLVLSRCAPESPELLRAMLKELAEAAGSFGMVQGQMLELAQQPKISSQEQLNYLHRCKTGRLLGAACSLGALSAGETHPQRLAVLRSFGETIGLAYQVIDDLLDDSPALGKTPGKDRLQAKETYLSLLGKEAAQDFARQQTELALSQLSDFGQHGAPLRWFAHSLLDRQS